MGADLPDAQRLEDAPAGDVLSGPGRLDARPQRPSRAILDSALARSNPIPKPLTDSPAALYCRRRLLQRPKLQYSDALLAQRVTGDVHRVGWPRNERARTKEFNEYLRPLGFNGKVLTGREKDGGLDVLWVLPVGTVPHRPLLSVQCKNGLFNLDDADKSVGAAERSLGEHRGLLERIHVPCVLFNDYIHPEMLTTKRLNFVPLGLTDLSQLVRTVSTNAL